MSLLQQVGSLKCSNSISTSIEKKSTDCIELGHFDTSIFLPASIVFITLFGIGKKTIWFGTMWWCFHFSICASTIAIIIILNCCYGCGPWFRFWTIIIPVCFAMQKVGISCWWLLLWCNQTYIVFINQERGFFLTHMLIYIFPSFLHYNFFKHAFL